MVRRPLCPLFGLAALIACGTVGCAGQGAMFLPLSSVLQMKEPVRIGITRVHMNPVVPAPWAQLERDLGRKLNRPVQVIAYRPFQLRSQLDRGFLDFAILSATDFAQVGDEGCILLAKPINSLGETTRSGLIIARKDARLQSLADLKDQRFAFGPNWDAASHLAAADALMRAGLKPVDLQRELLPIPMSRRHHLDSYEVAKAVAYEPLLSAGAVDEVAWSAWPEKGGSLVLQTISRDEFRVVGTTVELPEGPIVASRKATPELVAAVKEYLLSDQVPDKALAPMDWKGFVAVSAGEYEPVVAMVRQLRQAGWVTEDVTPAPATAPATQPVVAQ